MSVKHEFCGRRRIYSVHCHAVEFVNRGPTTINISLTDSECDDGSTMTVYLHFEQAAVLLDRLAEAISKGGEA